MTMTMIKRTAALVLLVVGGFSAHAAGSTSANAGRKAFWSTPGADGARVSWRTLRVVSPDAIVAL